MIYRSISRNVNGPFRTPAAADEPLMEPRAVTEAEQLVAAENVPDRKIGVEASKSLKAFRQNWIDHDRLAGHLHERDDLRHEAAAGPLRSQGRTGC